MAVYQFGRCVIDSDQHQLLVSGIRREIEPQVFDLLLLLVEKGGELVSHDALIESVWRGRVVSDSAISVRINAARKAVGDDGNRQAIIKTVPRRGFRLVADIKRLDVADKEEQAGTSSLLVDPAARPIVGVFPFESHGDDLQPYLVRGIAEDIATELSRFAEIAVIAPYSTFRHDFRNRDHFDIARELGITHIICGSLAGKASLENLTVRLLSSMDGSSLWSERYAVNRDDYFEAQHDLVNKIVTTLTQGLKTHLTETARSKPPANLSAYECILRGLYIYKWGVGSIEEAGQAKFWFEQALELDPDYGRAQAWRECVASYWWSSPPDDTELAASVKRIDRAFASDESDHEIHRIKGALHMCTGDYELGQYHLAKAVEVNPNDAHILVSAGEYRSFLAENHDDLTYIDTAFERNPLHPAWYWQHRAVALFAHARYEEVISNMQKNSAETEVSHLYLAASHALLGQLGEAKQHIKQLHAMNPEANIDWLNIAYPTRCYEESEHRSSFIEGLGIAGLA